MHYYINSGKIYIRGGLQYLCRNLRCLLTLSQASTFHSPHQTPIVQTKQTSFIHNGISQSYTSTFYNCYTGWYFYVHQYINKANLTEWALVCTCLGGPLDHYKLNWWLPGNPPHGPAARSHPPHTLSSRWVYSYCWSGSHSY